MLIISVTRKYSEDDDLFNFARRAELCPLCPPIQFQSLNCTQESNVLKLHTQVYVFRSFPDMP